MKEHQHRGLTSAQVEESRRLHGDNLITPRKGDSAWKLFAEKFRDPIIQGGRERRVWGASPKAFGGPVCQNSAYGHTRSAARRADRKQRRIQACL